jgi:lambda family phage portal protein
LNEVKPTAETKSWGRRMGEFLDSCVAVYSPQKAADRMAARFRMDAARSFSAVYHDGASRDRLHDGKWLGSKISPDSAMESDLETLRGRSHELYRSDSLGGLVDMMVDHIVGQGFTCNAKIKKAPGLSEEAADGFNDEIEAMLERVHMGDAVRSSWWEDDRLLCRHLLVDGEAFLVMSALQSDSPIPLHIEIIDPERVETPPGKVSDPNCRLGIQYDSRGRVLGYWIRTTHPYDLKTVENQYKFVPVERCCHVLERWFAGQSRGYPWMTRNINDARDGKDIREAALVTAQTQACLSVWVKSPTPATLGASKATGTQTDGKRIQSVEPGSVNYINSTEAVEFLAPSGTSPLSELLTMNDRRIAAGMNVPYEFIARNWSGISFAGGRLILNGAKISVGVKQKLLITRVKTRVYNEAVRQGVIVGALSINPSAFNRRPWVYQRHQWTSPLWSYAINPGEEVKALLAAVQGNLTTQEAATNQYSGMDLEEVIPQRGYELDEQRAAGCLPPDVQAAEAAVTAAENAGKQEPANA